jgi:hypothetical protein
VQCLTTVKLAMMQHAKGGVTAEQVFKQIVFSTDLHSLHVIGNSHINQSVKPVVKLAFNSWRQITSK